jgi:hypothetical protein
MNNYQDLKSPGQNQVWCIAKAILEEFDINPTTTDGGEEKDAGYEAYKTLLCRLEKDQIVQQDIYTGQLIIEKDVATSYVNWLCNNAIKSVALVASGEQIDVDFNRISFNGSSIGSGMSEPLKVQQRIYQGGSKKPKGSTARAVLTLVKGDDIPTDGMRMTYLFNSRILIVTNGNHRAIAYKLLGLRNFPVEKLDIYDDYPNEKLNQALLRLESLYTLYDPRNTSISIRNESDLDLALKLGEAYGADSPGTLPSELYYFTKHDLSDPKSEKSAGMNTTFLDLLKLYTDIYQKLPTPRPQAWWQRLFQSGDKTPQRVMKYEEEQIRTRWLEWRATFSS